MKYSLKTVLLSSFLIPISLVFVIACSLAQPDHQTFLHRNGDSFSLSINKKPLERTPERRWLDANGTNAVKSYWSVEDSSGELCFLADTSTSGYGEFLQMGLTITEVRPDRPYARWKKYQTVPRTVTATHPAEPIWVPGKEFCPKEYFLTARLRYQKLPKGFYVVSVRYQGTKNWDVKHVWLEVE